MEDHVCDKKSRWKMQPNHQKIIDNLEVEISLKNVWCDVFHRDKKVVNFTIGVVDVDLNGIAN